MMRAHPNISFIYLFLLSLYLYKNIVASDKITNGGVANLRNGSQTNRTAPVQNEEENESNKNGKLQNSHEHVQPANKALISSTSAPNTKEVYLTDNEDKSAATARNGQDSTLDPLTLGLSEAFKLFYSSLYKPAVRTLLQDDKNKQKTNVHISGTPDDQKNKEETILLEYDNTAKNIVTDSEEEVRKEKEEESQEEDGVGNISEDLIDEEVKTDEDTEQGESLKKQSHSNGKDTSDISSDDNEPYTKLQAYINADYSGQEIETFLKSVVNLLGADSKFKDTLNNLTKDMTEYLQRRIF
ncbi:hypothetical protein, conserved [Plasmodium malariae]|uniref:Merozoite surface protein n=1 Tax=Plasmodium malariae TaxID=5858 RepID=A0A1C3KE68_PLAMA|nr:hypothetical protein, conserved [Plasmodium malariae]